MVRTVTRHNLGSSSKSSSHGEGRLDSLSTSRGKEEAIDVTGTSVLEHLSTSGSVICTAEISISKSSAVNLVNNSLSDAVRNTVS